MNLKKLSILIVSLFILTSCAITQDYIDFTWQQMQDHYQKYDIEQPKIYISEENKVNSEGFDILGCYKKSTNIIILYKYWKYSTIEHEFKHALGDNQGESECSYLQSLR